MANTNKPSGLTPVGYLNGSDWDGRGRLYHIDSGDTNAYYPGDPVSLQAGTETVSGEAYGLPTLTVGAAGAPCVGVVLAVGISPRGGPYVNPNDLTKVWRPAAAQTNTPWFALVADDPNIVYEIQEAATGYGTGTALTVSATSKNANFVLHAPATGVFVSGAVLDRGTAPNTTLALNLKLLGLSQRLDNGAYNTYGLYAKWLCLLNNHCYRAGVVGV